MASTTPEPPTFLAELQRRAHLVHGLSKDEAAVDLARMLLRVIPSLDSLVQQASYNSLGSVAGQTSAIENFVQVAGGLARWLAQPI